MRVRTFLATATGIAILVLASYAAVRLLSPELSNATPMNVTGSAPKPTPITHYGPEVGAITATLTSPDNVTIHIVAIQREPNEWLFHIQMRNNTGQKVAFLSSSSAHYFMVAGTSKPGVPASADQYFLKLTPPGPADTASHAALPALLAPHAQGDGWLVADLTNYAYGQPIALFYVYGTVPDTACASPTDPSSCHPDTGYRTLLWRLS